MEKPVQSSFLPARWRFDRLFFFSLGRLVPRGHSERIIASAEPLLSGVQFHSPSLPPPLSCSVPKVALKWIWRCKIPPRAPIGWRVGHVTASETTLEPVSKRAEIFQKMDAYYLVRFSLLPVSGSHLHTEAGRVPAANIAQSIMSARSIGQRGPSATTMADTGR